MREILRPRKRPGAGPDGEDELRAQPVVDEIHPARGPPLSRRNPRGTGGSRAAAGGRKGAHVLPSTNIVALGSMKTRIGWRRAAPGASSSRRAFLSNPFSCAEPVRTVFLAHKKEIFKTINFIFEQAD